LLYVLQRTTHAALVFGVGVSVLTLVGADLAIRVLAGPEFESAVPVLQILAPTLALGYVVAVWTLALVSLRRVGWVLAVNAAALAVTLSLTLVLVPSHGSEGGAVAVLAGQLLALPGFAIGLRRNRLGPLGEPWRLLLVVALAASVAVLAGTLIPVQTAVATIIAFVLYVGVLTWLRAIPPELLDLFRSRRRETQPSEDRERA
jgi:O-antigen/teichoic acid export membrane protein